jgi:hypothetical protein
LRRYAHAAGVHRNHLVVEPVEAGLALANDLGSERGVAVAWHRDLQFTVLALQPFAGMAFAAVARAAPGGVVLLVTQVIGQLGAERLLQQPPLKLFEQPVIAEQILRLLVSRHQFVQN